MQNKIIDKLIDKTRSKFIVWKEIEPNNVELSDITLISLTYRSVDKVFRPVFLASSNMLSFCLAELVRTSGKDGTKIQQAQLTVTDLETNETKIIIDPQEKLYELYETISFINESSSKLSRKLNDFISS